jgi:hypothetical protein
MNPLIRRPVVLGLASALVLVLAACTQAAPTDQADAEQAGCDAVDALETALQDFRDLDPATASSDDVIAARDAVGEAWDDVKASSAAIGDANEAAIDAAWEQVSTAVDEFSDDVPVSEAIVPVQDALGEVQSAFDEMRDGTEC